MHKGLPENPNNMLDYTQSKLKDIWLAGGCFWGVEAYMARIAGVADTTVGYANGKTETPPSYEEVCHRNTGHAETVHIRYDPDRLPLEVLLRHFFEIIDPTALNRQGGDVGAQYRTGIFFKEEADLDVIGRVLDEVRRHHAKPVVTEVFPLIHFHPAEELHQDYLEKNPGGYCHVSFDTLPKEFPAEKMQNYAKPEKAQLRARLTSLQYAVTQESATERPFSHPYYQNREQGLYVDVVTGEPLFFSSDQFDAGCGWPSFTAPARPEAVHYREDASHGMHRTEVRSHSGDSHLGHLFMDGPAEAGGRRFCINGAALRFIPKENLAAEGYGHLLARMK